MASPPINSSASSPITEFPVGSHPQSRTIDVIEHRIDADLHGIRRWRKSRNATLKDWTHRKPYHEYVHQLVEAGWENLQELDAYLQNAPRRQSGIVVSVLDITHDFKKKCWPDILNERELKIFMHDSN